MRYLTSILTAVVLATATACNGSDVVNPSGSVVGTWNLRTLNGSPLPVALSSSSVLEAEQLRLNNDGTYSDVASYSDGGTLTEVGFYDINNNLITFQDQTDGFSYTGSVSGNVLTESNNGFVGVYQRE
jgi:hypothetical protein